MRLPSKHLLVRRAHCFPDKSDCAPSPTVPDVVQMTNSTDRRMEGAIVEYMDPPVSGTDAPPWVVRDIAPTFFAHAAAELFTLAAEELKIDSASRT